MRRPFRQPFRQSVVMRTWRLLKRRTERFRWRIASLVAKDVIDDEITSTYQAGAEREWKAGGRQGGSEPLAWYLDWHDAALHELRLLGVKLSHEERLSIDLFLRKAYAATYFPEGAAKEYVELYHSN